MENENSQKYFNPIMNFLSDANLVGDDQTVNSEAKVCFRQLIDDVSLNRSIPLPHKSTFKHAIDYLQPGNNYYLDDCKDEIVEKMKEAAKEEEEFFPDFTTHE